MNRSKRPFLIAAGVAAAVFGIAFGAAPHSCEGGLTFYFWSGVAALLVMSALPFLTAIGHSTWIRLAWSLAFAAFAVAVWFAGLFLANVQIMCRLF